MNMGILMYTSISIDKKAPMTMVFVGGALGSRTGIVSVRADKYRVLCVDLPGLGSLKGQQLTTDTACDHVKSIIDTHVKGKKAIVGGYSMGIFDFNFIVVGGHFAMKFAAKYPDSCLAIILGGCANEYYGVGASLFGNVVNFVYKICGNELKANFVRKTVGKGVEKNSLRYVEQCGMYYDMWKPCFSIMEEPHEGFYVKLLSEFPRKILFLTGDKDFRSAEEKYVKAAGDRGTLHLIKDCDHLYLAHERTRKDFADAIQKFADDVFATLQKPES